MTANGANFQMANVGLAVAENKALTRWRFLPPILSGNCVNDQTERPQIYLQNGKYYLFTISHRSTFARGPGVDSTDPRFWYMDGPDGVYGFVGNGIRSDFQPLNEGSGLALGNPTNLVRYRDLRPPGGGTVAEHVPVVLPLRDAERARGVVHRRDRQPGRASRRHARPRPSGSRSRGRRRSSTGATATVASVRTGTSPRTGSSRSTRRRTRDRCPDGSEPGAR